MKKMILVSLLVLVIAVLVPAASAQEAGAGCFNLSADDCALLQSASANTNTVTSFMQNFSIDFAVGGLESFDPTLPAITFNVSGTGPLTFTPDNPLVPFSMALDMVVNASGLMDAPLENAEVPFALVADTLYTTGNGELIGIPLNEETLNLGDAAAAFGVPVNPQDLLGGEGDAPTNLGELFGFGDMNMNPSGTDLSPYIDYVRLPDEDMMGQTMYPFQFTVDLTSLLNSPEFTQFMGMVGGLAGDDPNVQQGLALLPMLLGGVESDMVITQWVGADDNFIHKLTFDLSGALDLAFLTGGASAEGAPAIPPITLDLVFDVEISDINSEFVIAAPEGARILSPEEIQGLMGSVPGVGAGA
ncbi:MAG: hypothetical protein OHK0046_45020 [Anaerolineae bacterium]